MRSTFLKAILGTAALAGAGVLLCAGVSSAADIAVNLQAQSFSKTLPGGATVPMWRFVCEGGATTNCIPSPSGSPRINVGAGDNLTIHLTNTLPVPVSIMIPGQAQSGGGPPVVVSDTLARDRVQSFTHETGAGETTTPVPYTWNSLRAGTYLYQSATHPSIQVPMGLFGALVVGPATGASCPAGQQPAYDDVDSCYDDEALLLFSEIDPFQNERVADMAPGGPPTTTCESLKDWMPGATADWPCTVDYNPTYFLINGEPYDRDSPPTALSAGDPGETVLLRLLNAGSTPHAPTIVGLDLWLLAEDGNHTPGLLKGHSTTLLPAGGTRDALVALPGVNATYPLFDRMLDLSNDNQPGGGMLAYLEVGSGSPPVTPPTVYAVDDMYPVMEDTPLLGATSVLANDVGLGGATVEVVSEPSNGTLVMNTSDGTFDYTPNPNFSGADGFTYSATLSGSSYPAQVTLNVSFVNDAPVAADDGPYVNAIGPNITVAAPGVLGNDSDPEGDTLTAWLDSGPDVTLNPDGSFTYTGGTSTTFTYFASDDGGVTFSAPATVTLNINPVANIALTVQDPNGAPVSPYRWVVQEDATYHVDPAAPAPLLAQQSLNFHKSYMPVVAQGSGPVEFADVALDPLRHYYVSVLPDDAGTGGHTIGGTPIPPGTSAVTVIVNTQPIPTSQLSVFVFMDDNSTNGVPDPPEVGAGGVQIILEEAGGRYGISGGTMMQDAFGEPLKNSLFGSDSCPGTAPTGVILTCPDGTALIRDLPPAKYGIIAVAPPGSGWTQTSTIEGSPVIDAWPEAGNPPYFVEFGVPTFHAFIGFVDPAALVNPGGGKEITGQVTLVHDPRPPAPGGTFATSSYEPALSHTRAWVGLNINAGAGPNIQSVQADADGSFTLTDIPEGTHQLVIWDNYLDTIIAYQTVIVPPDVASADAGQIPVNAWFARSEHNVYLDLDENGVRDEGEPGLPEQNVNMRWRDGTINQAFPTDTTGFVPFDETFPFFHWQVFDVDFARFKPTGLTVTVDAGGDVSSGGYVDLLNPQVQSEDCTPGSSCLSRTETGPVLTEAFQGFAGQTSIFDWGKAPYHPGENGGIAGIVFYSSTRGENDPRFTVGDPWEPGIPGVKVRLYREVARDPALQDENVFPFDDFPGPGDTDLNGNGIFEGPTALSLVQEVTTDSWDAAPPTNCPGEISAGSGDPFVDQTLGGDATRCYDGWRNWNQARPGIFDGGYAFTGQVDENGEPVLDEDGHQLPLPPGKYVVEVVTPPGYELYKEEDKNVDFGDTFETIAPVALAVGPVTVLAATLPDLAMVLAVLAPEPGLAQPPCVGEDHLVAAELSLFPGVETYAPFANTMRPLCDRKEIILSDQGQAAADFFLFTSTPVAAQFTGLITDDLATEPNPASPGFGEKWSPPYLPFSMRDFKGHEVYRGYSDAFGHFNGVIPSTYSANIPVPSGYSPNMLLTCLNDPGDGLLPDPNVNSLYGPACYTLQFMPGTTTYLDTPILPQAAFAAGYSPVDCALPDGTPVVRRVNGSGAGPWIHNSANNLRLTIQSSGTTQVPNPAYEGPLAPAPYNQPTIPRDFGFGNDEGTVKIGDLELDISNWNNSVIQADLPPLAGTCNGGPNPGAPCFSDQDCRQGQNRGTCEGIPDPYDITDQLVVTRGDNGQSSINAVTVTVSDDTPIRVPDDYPTIQAAIDDAPSGSLILVAAGTYDELVIMWKPVRLQGAGAGTVIDAVKRPPVKLEAWEQKILDLIAGGFFTRLPGQPAEFDLVGRLGLFADELGAGITVLANDDPDNVTGRSFLSGANPSRIDGFTITNADGGGGIFVNAYAHNLEISNNHVTHNSGVLHGGIRVGDPFLPLVPDPVTGLFGINRNVNIHHNAITLNGGLKRDGAGGGLSVCTGSDNYTVSRNFVCGNLKLGDGGGFGHLGLSDGGLIEGNWILFNQSFNQGLNKSGGGIIIAGEPPAAGGLTLGAGNVTLNANLVMGNHAGGGHGGGFRAQLFNGTDWATPWNLTITNNMFVNNVAAWSGGGISLQDAINASIIHNTIAHNDTTATAGGLINLDTSDPQPAGISSDFHSPALAAVLPDGAPGFSDPTLDNNIVWHNRAFSYDATTGVAQLLPVLSPASVGDCPSGASYWDLGVLGEPVVPAGGPQLHPTYSILSSLNGYNGASNNVSADPVFLNEYCNGARRLSTLGPMEIGVASGEGGNFIDVRYGPLTQSWPAGSPPWDYHVGTSAHNGTSTAVNFDFDGESRAAAPDIGADEVP